MTVRLEQAEHLLQASCSEGVLVAAHNIGDVRLRVDRQRRPTHPMLALIVPSLISAFGIFLCRQFSEDIPDSVCESALIDGAGAFTIYFRIPLPQLKPAIGALAIFTFLATWNNYLGPLIMLDEMEKMTLPLALSFFRSQHLSDISAIMAAATLVMLPVTLVFLAFQKQFIKGVSLTGMK